MPITLSSQGPFYRYVGDEWVTVAVTYDDDGNRVTPTVGASVLLPDDTSSVVTPTEDGTGVWVCRHTLTVPGWHHLRFVASGTVVGVEIAQTNVESVPTSVDDGWPDTSACLAYLGETSASDAEILDALTAETAAQRARCRIPPAYPADLRQALLRRVARNLAARAVPVASFTSFEGGGTSARVPRTDAEISRLEGPYLRRTVG